jgi:hypothetical protein
LNRELSHFEPPKDKKQKPGFFNTEKKEPLNDGVEIPLLAMAELG